MANLDEFRKVEKSDEKTVADIFEIIQSCATWMSEVYGFKHWSSYYSSPEIIRKKLKLSVAYILYSKEGNPIATVMISSHAPPYYVFNHDGPGGSAINYVKGFTPVPAGKVFYVSALGVHPAFQKLGLGRKLMVDFVEQTANLSGIQAIRFDTRKEFTPVVRFYEKLGYSIRPMEIKGDVPDENYLLFEKLLKEN